MVGSGKSKYLVLFLLLLILLLCLFATTYYLVTRSFREVGYYQQALQAFEKGETARAKELMQRVIREDWNNELAITALADWFDRDEEWNYAAWLWLRAANLNALKPEYLQKARRGFFKSHAFQETFNSFEQKKIPLSDSETLQYAYSALSIGKREQAAGLFASVTGPEVRNSPLARLLSIYLPVDSNKTKEQTFAELTALLNCQDKFVVFECLIDLHYLEMTHFKRPDAGLARLQEAAALNPVNGIPLLGDYYFIARQYDKAAETYQKNPDNGFWDLPLISRFAEALTLTRQTGELEKLSRKCQTGDKELLICGYYLDALHALLTNDSEKLVFAFEKTEGRFQSPMAQLLNLLVQIQKMNHFEIEKLARFFSSDPNLVDFRARADQALFPHLHNLIRDQQIANAAALARIMQKDRKPELLLTRLDVADRARQGLLDRAEINKALRTFPGDEFLLQQAIEVNLKAGNYQTALTDAEKLTGKNPDSPEAPMLAILALAGLQKFTEADAEFAALLAKHPENLSLLNNFLNYCSSHKRLDAVLGLIGFIEQSGKAEVREYLPVVKAMAAVWRDQPDEAEKQLTDLATGNPELLYHAAFLLAGMDQLQPAIRLYQKIGEDHPKYPFVLLNLSELFSRTGSQAQALALARKAWTSSPGWPAARECYGLRLLENGKEEKAVEILDELMLDSKSSVRVRENWRKAMHKVLEKQFTAARYDEAQNTCRRLLLHWHNDPQAVAFAARIRQALQELEKAAQDDARKAQE